MPARLLCALLVLGVAACGDDPRVAEPAPSPAPAQRAVTGSLDLERPPAGPPDAGTQGGHRAGAARGETRQATFSFDGVVSPAHSEVTAEGADAVVRMLGDHGDFTVEVSGLHRGRNRLTLRASAEGHVPWSQDVVITRR